MGTLNRGLTASATILSAAARLSFHGFTAASGNEPEGDGSPRLARLSHELQAGNREALAAFWKEMQSNSPLVEPIASDQRHRRVTFLWRGSDKTTRVTVLGGLPGANLAKLLTRLDDTDLWYLTRGAPR